MKPTAVPLETAPISFSSLADSLHPNTLKALTGTMGLKTLSIVQEKILPMLPELVDPYTAKSGLIGEGCPRDLLVKSRTGTGKTLAFLIPAVESRQKAYEEALVAAGVEKNSREARSVIAQFGKDTVGAVIISPTRELAMQIAKEASTLAQHHRMGVKLFVGGESKGRQMREWNFGSKDIVVATPGRLMDVLENERGMDPIRRTQMFILDEADTLLDMGFRDDIERIKEYLPPSPERQTFMFSATVSRAIQQIAQSSLSQNHAFVNCVPVDSSPVHAHIPQHYTVLPSPEQQIPHIMRLIAHDQLLNPGSSKVMVFLPTTKLTEMFSDLLSSLSMACLPVGARTTIYEIHSKKTQQQRAKVSDMFRKNRAAGSVLVTSDVSARGVDYPGVTRVIQVGACKDSDQYIHRVGRTGRAGTSGRGDIVLLPWEMKFATKTLSQVPLVPVTVAELETQVRELAAEVDSDPKEFLRSSDSREPSIAKFDLPYEARADQINVAVEKSLTGMDGTIVGEAFASMLGFYAPLADVLRTSKEAVIDGLKDWATVGCKLDREPHVSSTMLQRLGMGGGGGGGGNRRRDSSFGARAPWNSSHGGSSGGGSGYDSGAPKRSAPWMGRGSSTRGGSSSGSYDRSSSFSRGSGGSRYGGEKSGGYGGSGERRSGGYERKSGGDRGYGGF
ncbi:P-loop containing nucleoside triphosphate hydrolase protein [Cyathus striatus]|nr:P-loop containing nucleoside triphosphate hydrolase protein [Cyathus striatus]